MLRVETHNGSATIESINHVDRKLDLIHVRENFFKKYHVKYLNVKILSIKHLLDFVNPAFKADQQRTQLAPSSTESDKAKTAVTSRVLPFKPINFISESKSGSICSSSSSESISSLRSIYSDIERRSINQSEYIKDLVDNAVTKKVMQLEEKFNIKIQKIEENYSNKMSQAEERYQSFRDEINGKCQSIIEKSNTAESQLFKTKAELIEKIYTSKGIVQNSNFDRYEAHGSKDSENQNDTRAPIKEDGSQRNRQCQEYNQGNKFVKRPLRVHPNIVKLLHNRSADNLITFVKYYNEYSFPAVLNCYVDAQFHVRDSLKMYEKYTSANDPDDDVWLKDLFYSLTCPPI